MNGDLPRIYAPEELRPGLSAEFEREIAERDVLDFAAVSGDRNPLHVDASYAAGTNFGGRIVHGAFQVGLASAMIGMYLPGRDVLLVSSTAQFAKPLYFPCRVRVHGELASWDAAARRGNLRVRITELATGIPVSDIYMGFTFHELATRAEQPAAANSMVHSVTGGDRRTVLITGASGGIGLHLVEELSRDYDIIAQVNRNRLPEAVAALPGVSEVAMDFSLAGWEEALPETTRLYGIVHAAWPGLPQGGLLNSTADVLQQQLSFGTVHTVGLARMLVKRCGGAGRLTVLGSTAGTHKPVLSMAAYSLGKAALEHCVRLLAPELGLHRVTVNAVCPSFVPTGMNRQATERQRKTIASQIPAGRLCEPQDVASAIRFLLSEPASFVSGQIVTLSGGQL